MNVCCSTVPMRAMFGAGLAPANELQARPVGTGALEEVERPPVAELVRRRPRRRPRGASGSSQSSSGIVRDPRIDSRNDQSSVGSPRWENSQSVNASTRRPSWTKLPGTRVAVDEGDPIERRGVGVEPGGAFLEQRDRPRRRRIGRRRPSARSARASPRPAAGPSSTPCQSRRCSSSSRRTKSTARSGARLRSSRSVADAALDEVHDEERLADHVAGRLQPAHPRHREAEPTDGLHELELVGPRRAEHAALLDPDDEARTVVELEEPVARGSDRS